MSKPSLKVEQTFDPSLSLSVSAKPNNVAKSAVVRRSTAFLHFICSLSLQTAVTKARVPFLPPASACLAFSSPTHTTASLAAWVVSVYNNRLWDDAARLGEFDGLATRLGDWAGAMYRERQKYTSQVLGIQGEKIAFFCLLQAGDRKFLSSYSPNLGFVDLPIPVHHKQIYLLLWHP